jgi:alkylated DNA repair dioxygenase AlkB
MIHNFLNNDELIKNKINEEHFKTLFEWSEMRIKGSPVSRLLCVQAKKNNNGHYPVYRHPFDEFPKVQDFNFLVLLLRDFIANRLGYDFNHVLIHYYRDGNDHIGKHSDKTLDILPNTPIVNYTVGATRMFELTHKEKKKTLNINLCNNSLLVLGLKTNAKYYHTIKQAQETGSRLSFTFRCIGTFLSENNTVYGLGAPKSTTRIDDKQAMIEAFHFENKLANFDRNKYYVDGFWSLVTNPS